MMKMVRSLSYFDSKKSKKASGGGPGNAAVTLIRHGFAPWERSNNKIPKDATETATTGLPIEQDSEAQEKSGPVNYSEKKQLSLDINITSGESGLNYTHHWG